MGLLICYHCHFIKFSWFVSYCYNTALLVASVGLSFLQFTNMNSMRNLFITGVAFFLGLSVPEYFREYTTKAYHGPAHTRAGWVSSIIQNENNFLDLVIFHDKLKQMNASSYSVQPTVTGQSTTYHEFYFDVQFNDYLNTIFFSSPTVALIVAVFLDNTLDYKESARDRGMPWWVKFRTFKGDSRNEEFYTLPFNLDRFFPPSWANFNSKERC